MQTHILVLAFLAVYQLSSRVNISPRVAASLVIATPFIMTLILRLIYGSDISHLMGWGDVIILTFQFAAYYFIFHRSQHDESIASWIGWGVAGLLVIPVLSAGLAMMSIFR